MRIRPRFRAAGTVAATVLAMLAALMITPSAAVAAPGQSGTAAQNGTAAPKPPPGFEDAAVLKVERKDRSGYYIYCYVYVSNAYRVGSGVGSITNVTCVDEFNAYVAVDGIYIDTTIYRAGVPWQSNAGAASFFPYLNVGVNTSDCVTEYYYTRSYVQVVFPPNTTPPFLDGVFYSPNNVLVIC